MALPIEPVRQRLEIQRLKQENEELREALYKAVDMTRQIHAQIRGLKEKAHGKHARIESEEESSRYA